MLKTSPAALYRGPIIGWICNQRPMEGIEPWSHGGFGGLYRVFFSVEHLESIWGLVLRMVRMGGPGDSKR